MSSVEVLGSLDGYPPLLTIDEAAEMLRIGRSLAYGLAHQYESSDGRDGLPVLRFGSCIRVPRWALAGSSPPDGSSGWPMDRRADTDGDGRPADDTVAVIVGAAAAQVRRQPRAGGVVRPRGARHDTARRR